jgi:hypothetical protein
MAALDTYYLNFVIKQLYLKAAINHKVNHLGKNLIAMTPVITDTTDPDGRQLPDIIVINLSHGHIKLITHAAGNGL